MVFLSVYGRSMRQIYEKFRKTYHRRTKKYINFAFEIVVSLIFINGLQ